MKPQSAIIFICLQLSVTMLPLTSHAFSWPTFSPPTRDLLLDLHAIDTNLCPPDQGRISSKVSINIQQFNCKTFCPKSWTWTATSDDKCHDLNEFTFKEYEISHFQDTDGTTSYSQIKAYYGSSKTSHSILNFTFATEPGEHWYCYQADQEAHLIMCANDI